MREYRMPGQGFVFRHPAPGLARSWIVAGKPIRRVVLRKRGKYLISQLDQITPGSEPGFLQIPLISWYGVPELAQDGRAFRAF